MFAGAGGGDGAGVAVAGLGADRAVDARATTVCADDFVFPVVPVGAVDARTGMSIKCWTRSLICAVTTCMRCVSSVVSISVSCCAATWSARLLLAYE